MVCNVLQWDTYLTSLWGFGGVQCVPVGHPLDQAGWDQLTRNGSQSAWLICFSFSFFKSISTSVKMIQLSFKG